MRNPYRRERVNEMQVKVMGFKVKNVEKNILLPQKWLRNSENIWNHEKKGLRNYRLRKKIGVDTWNISIYWLEFIFQVPRITEKNL